MSERVRGEGGGEDVERKKKRERKRRGREKRGREKKETKEKGREEGGTRERGFKKKNMSGAERKETRETKDGEIEGLILDVSILSPPLYLFLSPPSLFNSFQLLSV